MTRSAGWDRPTSPYHLGEQALHARLGRQQRQEALGRRMHRPYLPDQHRAFYAQLPFVVLGSVDGDGWPWASFLFGAPGFIRSPTDRTLVIETEPPSGDPAADYLAAKDPVGLLGIEFATRRRNRANGVVRSRGPTGLHVEVVQSYGNCPQYIQTRNLVSSHLHEPEKTVEPLAKLDEDTAELLRSSDTFFVASANPREDILDTGGTDVSHRGGRPGFVKVEGDTLTIPEFSGNFAYNTLGNFLVYPRAGLLFVDFDSGDLVQLTGTVELIWDPDEELQAFPGAERGWRCRIEHGVRRRQACPLRGRLGEASPRTLETGLWPRR